MGVDAGRAESLLGRLGRAWREGEGRGLRLAWHDRRTALLYARHRGAVVEVLGEEARDSYLEALSIAVRQDIALARQLARTLPDQLASVEPGRRPVLVEAVLRALRTRPEATPLVVTHLPGLLDEVDDPLCFLDHALEVHRESEPRAASLLRLESLAAEELSRQLEPGVRLEDVRPVLTLYAHAHCGRSVEVAASSRDGRPWTDGRRLFLPERIARFGDERDFLAYRVGTALCAAYLEFGTFDLCLDALDGEWASAHSGETDLERLFRSSADPGLTRALFGVLEEVRVEAEMCRAYPGLARDVEALSPPPTPTWQRLSRPDRLAEALARGFRGHPVPPWVASEVDELLDLLAPLRRGEATVHDTVAVVAVLTEQLGPGSPPPEDSSRGGDPAGFPLAGLRPEELPGGARAVEEEIRRQASEDGWTSPLPRLRTHLQAGSPERASYEEMVAWLERAEQLGGALVEPSEPADEATAPAPATTGESCTGPMVYPEWDSTIEDYKPAWVSLSEHRVQTVETGWAETFRSEHAGAILRLRRRFEAMRPDAARRRRRLLDGEDIDYDAAIAACLERRAGGASAERVYASSVRSHRDVCVAFLVDLSSSTNELANDAGERIIDVEKQALLCISEALDALGDRFAVFGFSGFGRDQVALYVAKDFHEPLTDGVRARVGSLGWKMENRDGAAIRHCTRRLLEQPARTRVLFLISDGRPLDCGCSRYFDRYAQEDTRVALVEARRAGVFPFCITVDPRAHDYLERMYGVGSYTIVADVDTLPDRLPLHYRRLTL